MANKKAKKQGELLITIATQSYILHDYITNPQVNEGKIRLKVLKEMSNVIVNNIKALEELDKQESDGQA